MPRWPFAALAALALPACSGGGGDAGGAGQAPSPKVALETSLGRIEVELAAREAPLTVENFLTYVDDGHFDGTVFHRVVGGFVVQGGGFAAQSGMLIEKETRKPIRNEARDSGLSNLRGTLAMARTDDPDSATAQFFVNLVDNSASLDPGGFSPDGYCVFGRVTAGMEVIDKIATAETKTRTLVMLTPSGNQTANEATDVPAEDVIITSAKRIGG